jgi:glycerophosphoryl diester phosphodiesterase
MKPLRRAIPLALAAILFAMPVVGCALPAHTRRLDTVLAQEEVHAQSRYGYPCTAGAHRGASVRFLENTRAALQAADSDPRYAFIEFDVQYSRDGRIVVFHDKRMLRLFGRLEAVGDTDFADLARLSGGEITAYDEVIGTLGKRLNIEIKSRGDLAEDQRLVDAIVADLHARGRLDDLLISSISGEVVRYVNRRYPEVPTGQIFWLTASTYLPFEALTRNLYDEVAATGAGYLMLHIANLHNIDDLLRYKPKGKTIVFWDFDDTMYIVHKDFSDRLWGDSGIENLFRFLRYKLSRG